MEQLLKQLLSIPVSQIAVYTVCICLIRLVFLSTKKKIRIGRNGVSKEYLKSSLNAQFNEILSSYKNFGLLCEKIFQCVKIDFRRSIFF